jgi:hypothetical protein
MNTQPEQNMIDIVSLVDNNPLIKINKNYNNDIIDKILSNFTNNEQQLFVANFYIYLNYDTRKDYVIELDNIWKWLGFSRIDHCKNVIVNNFKINEDYMAEKAASASAEAGPDERNLGGSGLNKERIKMTVNCFKKLCLKSKTKKADEIHEYYIKMEEILNEVLKKQTEELVNQLQILQKENISIKEKTMIDAYNEKPVLYLAIAEENISKFGFSNGIKTRINTHKREIGPQFTLCYVIETIYNRELEQLIKKNLKDSIISKKYENKKEECTELVQLSETFTIDDFYNTVLEYKKQLDNGEIVSKLMAENDELKNEIEVYKNMKLEKINNDEKISTLIHDNERLKNTIPSSNYFVGNLIYIRYNDSTKLHKIGIHDGTEQDPENYKEIFTHESANSVDIFNMLTILLKSVHIKDYKYSVNYDTLKKTLDHCVIIYDNYKIKESEENINFFINKFNSRTVYKKTLEKKTINKEIFNKFFGDIIIKDENYKIPLVFIQEEFFEWYKINYGNPDFIKSGLHWSTNYREDLVDNLQKYLDTKMTDINIVNYDKSLYYHNYAGFVGISTLKFEEKIKECNKYYSDEQYSQYIDKFVIVTNNPRHKLARGELLEDFTNYAKQNNFYNKYTFGKIFSMKFAEEVVNFIEKYCKIKYEKIKTKREFAGIFVGITHSKFNCIGNN